MVKNLYKQLSIFSFFLIAVCGGIILFFGIPLGPSFTGGSSITFSYEENVSQEQIVKSIPFEIVQFRQAGDKFSIKFEVLSEQNRIELINVLEGVAKGYATDSYTTYGPTLGNELLRKSIVALILASLIIIIFVSYAFSSVSKPVSSWKYGCIAVIALLHDIIIPVGVFSLLTSYGAQVDILFIMALLAIIGYSINDTLVIFDRIREYLKKTTSKTIESFENAIENGVASSMRRSVFTSLTTSVPLLLLFFYVPAVSWFALTLFIGVAVGTYSSLFFAPSLLLLVNRLSPESDKKEVEKTPLQIAEEELLQRIRNDE